MSSALYAVEWSRDHLRYGGIFAMDDYVGGTRNQHSRELVAWGTRLLAALPEYLRAHCRGGTIPPSVSVVNPEDLAKLDPSECADSGSILSAVKSVFPGAEIIHTGGAGYFVALTYVLQNFRSETELALLQTILMADEAALSQIESQYSVAIALKAL
jgi:hypothetical protein